MDDMSEILNKARQRAQEMKLPYAGALLPAEAYQLMQKNHGARLIDVRTRPEWDFVGRVPGSIQIEWQTYPNSQPNAGKSERLSWNRSPIPRQRHCNER